MSFRKHLVLLGIVGSLTCCNTGAQSTPDKGWELKTYDVPADIGPELQSALRNLFVGKDMPQLGQAMLAPNGQLLVTAPHSYMQGIDALISAIANKKAPAPASIQLSYWAVIGKRAAKAQIPPELQPIAGTLDVISKSQGGLSFTSLETVSLRAMSGRVAKSEGAELHVEQSASERDGTVVADIEIRQQKPQAGPRGRIETRVKIPSGQTVVLGQAGYTETKEPTSVFYVVRAEVEAR